jgi:hypothetical protein
MIQYQIIIQIIHLYKKLEQKNNIIILYYNIIIIKCIIMMPI